MRLSLALPAILALTATPAVAQSQSDFDWGEKNVPDFEPAWPNQTRAPITQSPYTLETEVLAGGLVHPWAIEALPEGGYLVTERPGTLRHVTEDGTISDPISGVPEVFNQAADGSTQAGLLDVKVGPTFAEDRMVYLTYSKPMEDDKSVTAAARGVLSDDLSELTGVEDIWVQHPPSSVPMHYGSRIVFDGEGHAFITTGDRFSFEERDKAQHLDKTYGKVIRVNLDGSIPDSNPYVGNEDADDAIWSYGHRNIQGAAMHNGMLYTMEHGPAGGDELNLPLPAHNYGWPIVSYGVRYNGPHIGTGEPRLAGMMEPLYYWDPVIAPGDIVFHDGTGFPEWEGDLLVAALVSGGIVRVDLQDGLLAVEEERLLSELGRVRDIEFLDDGSFLVATDYEDGAIVHVTGGGTN